MQTHTRHALVRAALPGAIALVLALSVMIGAVANAANPAPVVLGTADQFAVMTAGTLYNNGTTVIDKGKVGWTTSISGTGTATGIVPTVLSTVGSTPTGAILPNLPVTTNPLLPGGH